MTEPNENEKHLFESISPLLEGLISLHEMMNNLMTAGFTERQAVQFVAEMTYLHGKGE